MATAINSPVRSATARRRFGGPQGAGFWFVLPSIICIMVFFIVPLLMAVWVSLHNWPLFGKQRFVGFANYIALWNDQQFWSSLWFTTKYALMVTPPIFLLGFALALLVNRALPGVGLFRTAFFLPNVISFGAACLLWYYMLNDRIGVFNALLRGLGLIQGSVLWLNNYNTAMIAIVLMVVWKTAGGTMLLLLIGLQAIPDDLYQAAEVDGAGAWARMRFITLPLLKRTFALALVLSVTGSYLAFDQFYILTAGGPRNQTVSLVYWITKTAFVSFKVGYATTISMVLLVLLVALNALQLSLLRDTNQY